MESKDKLLPHVCLFPLYSTVWFNISLVFPHSDSCNFLLWLRYLGVCVCVCVCWGGGGGVPKRCRPLRPRNVCAARTNLRHLTRVVQRAGKSILNYLEILYEFQFGFRKGHSTSQAITGIAENPATKRHRSQHVYTWGVVEMK